MERKDPTNNSILPLEINNETSEKELINIIAQEPYIYFKEREFKHDDGRFADDNYNQFRIGLESPETGLSEKLRIIFNKHAKVNDEISEWTKFGDKGVLLIIKQNPYRSIQHRNTLIYSQGLEENTIYLENNEKQLNQEEGSIKINLLLERVYYALYKAKAYALLRNSMRERSMISDNNFRFMYDRNDHISTTSIDMILEIIKHLHDKSTERIDKINTSSIKYQD